MLYKCPQKSYTITQSPTENTNKKRKNLDYAPRVGIAYIIHKILENLARRKSATINFTIKNGSVIPIMRSVIPVIPMFSQRLRRT